MSSRDLAGAWENLAGRAFSAQRTSVISSLLNAELR